MVVQRASHVVVDSGAFMKCLTLQDLGETIYSTQEVVAEIKDRQTRQRLQVLPYELNLREPAPECIHFVTEFAKRTGDYTFLSATDIKVLALTYQLEKEVVGVDHLRKEPSKTAQGLTVKGGINDNVVLPGFFHPATEKNKRKGCLNKASADIAELSFDAGEKAKSRLENPEATQNKDEGKCSDYQHSSNSDDMEAIQKKDDSEHSSDSDEYDAGGWINKSNIESFKLQIEEGFAQTHVKVACITTDFSMQNVLLQIGLNVMSVDGMLINQIRTYVLRCYSCFKVTKIMTKTFCPNCGNKTLKRVAATFEEDGSATYYISKRPINVRGSRYSLPLPQGGKRGINPVFTEDQRFPHTMPSRKALEKTNALDPDYVGKVSPFAMNDVTSRAAQLTMSSGKKKNWMQRNPNQTRKPHRKK